MAIDQVVLSKYLFQQGQNELSKNTPISCGLAISLFQDSVELLIRAIGKEYDAKITDHTQFAKFWESIENARHNTEKITLPLRAKMLELNKARANFKHHGILPDVSEGRKFSTYAEDFLREATQLFFHRDFDEISLADLIENPEVKQVIKDAETSIREGDFEKCLIACAKAEHIASGTVRTIAPEVPSSFRDFGRLFDREKSSLATSWAGILDSYLRVQRQFSIAIALKLNLSNHAKFHVLIPDAVRYQGGRWQFNIKRTASRDDADFCLKYVTRYALAVQDQFAELIKLPPAEVQ